MGPCKECIQKEIGYDIIKAIPYLDLFNLPYIPEKWNEYIIRAKKNNITFPFGYYLAYCKLMSIRINHFTDILIYPNSCIKKEEYEKFHRGLIKYINSKFNKESEVNNEDTN